ncbi:hypothetical protein HDU88_000009 [Geranomyces variabilis]|nr:hypothetical protein HDU88_000009 [Geranomyces variabilis]
MRFPSILASVTAILTCVSRCGAAVSLCDKYTTALFTNNTDANQLKLLTALVNTVIIGNYSTTANNKIVPGILQTATINGTAVNLAPFFSGAGKTTNRNGVATTVNFLDGGGGAPLANNTAATDTSSNQYSLVNHLYQYFGYLLQCSLQGTAGFPAYSGSTSMYTTHKFMNLRNEDVTYFIQQVGAAASSFGVADADVNTVAALLASSFGVSCAPKAAIPSSATADLQPQPLIVLYTHHSCHACNAGKHSEDDKRPDDAVPDVLVVERNPKGNVDHRDEKEEPSAPPVQAIPPRYRCSLRRPQVVYHKTQECLGRRDYDDDEPKYLTKNHMDPEPPNAKSLFAKAGDKDRQRSKYDPRNGQQRAVRPPKPRVSCAVVARQDLTISGRARHGPVKKVSCRCAVQRVLWDQVVEPDPAARGREKNTTFWLPEVELFKTVTSCGEFNAGRKWPDAVRRETMTEPLEDGYAI